MNMNNDFLYFMDQFAFFLSIVAQVKCVVVC